MKLSNNPQLNLFAGVYVVSGLHSCDHLSCAHGIQILGELVELGIDVGSAGDPLGLLGGNQVHNVSADIVDLISLLQRVVGTGPELLGQRGLVQLIAVHSQLQLIIQANESMPTLIGADERGILWKIQQSIYLTSTDFSATTLLMENFIGMFRHYYNGYLYYFQPGEPVSCTYDPVQGDFDEKFSSSNTGISLSYSMDCWRIRTEEGAQPQLVSSPNCMHWEEASYLDAETGTLYLQPLNPAYLGCTIWQDPTWTEAAAQQMGYSGKPILSHYVLRSGGSVMAIDLDTLEKTEVYTGLDGDITGIYGLHNGALAVKYEVLDREQIEEFMNRGLLTDRPPEEIAHALLQLKGN